MTRLVMPGNDPTARRYDAMPYESHAFHESHPDHLACLATLYGMSPPAVPDCRVLELGCASGGNLIPMALELPGATFLGVDLSSRQIGDGQATIDALGLTNIELQAADLSGLSDEIGPFDYVIAHGVYSWVAEPVRDRMLGLIKAVLAPEGVAFISYNTLPGWHLLGIVRDLIRFHTDGLDDPEALVRSARALLDVVVEAMPDRTTPYALVVCREVEQLRNRGDSYLLHEFLEPESRPVHHREFVAHAAAHGLRSLVDARFRTAAANQPAELRATLERLSEDPVRREQYLDFIRNRTFRRTLIVRESALPSRQPAPERLDTLRAAAGAAPSSTLPDIHSESPEEFRSFDGAQRLTTLDPLAKAAMITLFELWPGSIPVPDLHRRVLHRLDDPPPHAGLSAFSRDSAAFHALLMHGYGLGMLDLRTVEPPLARVPGDRPTASPYARRQAESGRLVTNLLHRVVELSDFDRLVLRQLDGARHTSHVVDALVACAVSGQFPLSRDGLPLTDAIEIRQILQRSLEPSLSRLAAGALLVEPTLVRFAESDED